MSQLAESLQVIELYTPLSVAIYSPRTCEGWVLAACVHLEIASRIRQSRAWSNIRELTASLLCKSTGAVSCRSSRVYAGQSTDTYVHCKVDAAVERSQDHKFSLTLKKLVS